MQNLKNPAMKYCQLKLSITILLSFYLLPTGAQRPWQDLSMPTADQIRQGLQNPPPEYGPNLVWGWNGPMDEEVISRDLDQILSMGFRSVIIEAGYRMKEPYLSEGWFRLVARAVEHAKQRGMRVWLIDEGKYPSGFAGGKFSKERPDLRMQGLEVARRIRPEAGETLDLELADDIISAAAYNEHETTGIILHIQSGKLQWSVPGKGWEILMVRHRFRTSVTRASNNPTGGKDTVNSLCDYLNPEATRQFIEFTHEAYKKYLEKEFGNTLLGFRGDEPDYGFFPWTPSIPDKFIALKGYDIRPYIASFYLPDPDDKMRKARADYWDVWSALFGENFFTIQAEWCAQNNLEYMVHMNHEDKMMQLVRSGGDFFRNMRNVQIPGVDAIWNQIWMDKIADFPKLASSAAHLNGRPRALSESFAAYRIRPNVEQGKWVLDHQFARGINMFEIMFFGSSAEGAGIPRGWMASDSFPDLMAYANRVSWLLSQGRPAAQIALYMPTGRLWLGDEDANLSTWEIARQLLELQRDFDFIDDYSLSEAVTLSNGGLVNHSGQAYKAVLVPGTRVISTGALQRLKEFSSSGGKVIFMGREPAYQVDSVFMDAKTFIMPPQCISEPSGNISSLVLEALTDADVTLEPVVPSVKYVHRHMEQSDLYFLFNESGNPVSCTATFAGSGSVELLDLYSGETRLVHKSGSGKESIMLHLNMGPGESRAYLIGK